MLLEERIRNDMHAALKNQRKTELETLRTVVAQLKDERIKLMRDLTDDDVLTVLNRAVKRRKESIELFKQGNRPDLVENEQKQADIIQTYLPEQLSENAIIDILNRIISDVGAQTDRDMGRVMGPAMKELKGKADGKIVQNLVRKLLLSMS